MEALYNEWCRRIAESKDVYEIINHFREHVCDHFKRHDRAGKIGLDIWLIGAFNFMHILEKKFPYITTEDMLFKLCTYHRNHKGGSEPPLDMDEFLKKYNGEIKKFHKKANEI